MNRKQLLPGQLVRGCRNRNVTLWSKFREKKVKYGNPPKIQVRLTMEGELTKRRLLLRRDKTYLVLASYHGAVLLWLAETGRCMWTWASYLTSANT